MKKMTAILMLSILALFIITGCQSSKTTSPEAQTQINQATGTVVNDPVINEADEATQALDTTQVDKDLGSAGTSLSSW